MTTIKDILVVQIISLKARKKKAQEFILNKNLQLEIELLTAQIETLEAGLEKYKTDHMFE